LCGAADIFSEYKPFNAWPRAGILNWEPL